MMHKTLGALLIALAATSGAAQAEDYYPNLRYGAGLREYVPAPIPSAGAPMRTAVPPPPRDYGAVPAPMPVPMARPIPEGFTYYLRADLGWGFGGDRSFSESGRVIGNDGAPFIATGPVSFSHGDLSSDGSFLGTIGIGMYMTPMLRGDITIDFRSEEESDGSGRYSYVAGANTITGTIRNSTSMKSTVMLANLYLDLLPRGSFSPYIGAGIGFVYNDASRSYTETAVSSGGPQTLSVTGTGSETNVALAGALMAGVTIASGHAYAIDVGYRALYTGGIDVSTPLSNGQTSEASLDNHWEHQVRVGLRLNLQ